MAAEQTHTEFRVIEDLSGFDKALPVVHLKGYVSGLFGIHGPMPELGAYMKEQFSKGAVFVWDGDDFQENGFTRYISVLTYEHRDSKNHHFVAFKRAAELDAFKRSWLDNRGGLLGSRYAPIHVILAPDDLVGDQLSLHALRVTGAKRVVCMGGVEIVKAELDALKGSGVSFAVFRPPKQRSDRAPGVFL